MAMNNVAYRAKGWLGDDSQIPRIVVADESAMNYDGDSITTRLHDAFAGIYPESGCCAACGDTKMRISDSG